MVYQNILFCLRYDGTADFATRLLRLFFWLLRLAKISENEMCEKLEKLWISIRCEEVTLKVNFQNSKYDILKEVINDPGLDF